MGGHPQEAMERGFSGTHTDEFIIKGEGHEESGA